MPKNRIVISKNNVVSRSQTCKVGTSRKSGRAAGQMSTANLLSALTNDSYKKFKNNVINELRNRNALPSS